MSKDTHPSKVAIILGIISLVGTLGAALIANWSQFFSRDEVSSNNITETSGITADLSKVNLHVYTTENEPIEFAKVQFIFDGAPAPRYTDSNGYVSIEIPQRKDLEVILKKEGFQSSRQILNLEADPNKPITIYLQEKEFDEDYRSSGITNHSNAQSIDSLGIKQGMLYEKAREVLLVQGWQGLFPGYTGAFPNLDDPAIKYLFENKDFQEVQSCSGTGMGFCLFQFSNSRGEILSITTVNNQPGSEEITVWGWSLE